MELQWQREVIEKWLSTPNIPLDARAGLLEMLNVVKEDLDRLEDAHRRSLVLPAAATGSRKENQCGQLTASPVLAGNIARR
jgi:hypothetical protein